MQTNMTGIVKYLGTQLPPAGYKRRTNRWVDGGYLLTRHSHADSVPHQVVESETACTGFWKCEDSQEEIYYVQVWKGWLQ